MHKPGIRYVETVIIGGGFSGLFLSDGLANKTYKSFLLIEQRKNRLGGYVIQGSVKIGLLPAGEKTRRALPSGSYEYFEKEFIDRFGQYLYQPPTVSIGLDFASMGLVNKLYDSYILSKSSAHSLISELKKKFQNQIMYARVSNISRSDNGYEIHVNGDKTIRCKYLIIASGRYYPIINLMEQLGQQYSRDYDLLYGCRACFDPLSAERLFKHQVDFKVKDDNSYQTYCFNYRGNITSYEYGGRRVYTGSLNERGLLGNCFIGKKLLSRLDTELCKIKKPFKIGYKQFVHTDWPDPVKNDFRGVALFMTKLENFLDVQFIHLYFPALEQFWPRPSINTMTLQSLYLPNVFYIGDASGISFGLLQCYVTSNVLIEELTKRHVFH